jgi:hypothetical protein
MESFGDARMRLECDNQLTGASNRLCCSFNN